MSEATTPLPLFVSPPLFKSSFSRGLLSSIGVGVLSFSLLSLASALPSLNHYRIIQVIQKEKLLQLGIAAAFFSGSLFLSSQPPSAEATGRVGETSLFSKNRSSLVFQRALSLALFSFLLTYGISRLAGFPQPLSMATACIIGAGALYLSSFPPSREEGRASSSRPLAPTPTYIGPLPRKNQETWKAQLDQRVPLPFSPPAFLRKIGRGWLHQEAPGCYELPSIRISLLQELSPNLVRAESLKVTGKLSAEAFAALLDFVTQTSHLRTLSFPDQTDLDLSPRVFNAIQSNPQLACDFPKLRTIHFHADQTVELNAQTAERLLYLAPQLRKIEWEGSEEHLESLAQALLRDHSLLLASCKVGRKEILTPKEIGFFLSPVECDFQALEKHTEREIVCFFLRRPTWGTSATPIELPSTLVNKITALPLHGMRVTQQEIERLYRLFPHALHCYVSHTSCASLHLEECFPGIINHAKETPLQEEGYLGGNALKEIIECRAHHDLDSDSGILSLNGSSLPQLQEEELSLFLCSFPNLTHFTLNQESKISPDYLANLQAQGITISFR